LWEATARTGVRRCRSWCPPPSCGGGAAGYDTLFVRPLGPRTSRVCASAGGDGDGDGDGGGAGAERGCAGELGSGACAGKGGGWGGGGGGRLAALRGRGGG
jgi:hypothetical protein